MKLPPLFLLLLFWPAWALGQAPNVQAEARIDRATLELADALAVTFTVEGPKNLEVERIQAPSLSPLWEATPAGQATTTPLADGRVRWRQTFRLEPLQAGQLDLALTPLRYRLGDGPWIDHPWKDQTIEVTTAVIDPAITGLRGNSHIDPLPPAPEWPRWPIFVAVALLISSALLYVMRRQRREPSAAALPPKPWALRELERIEGLALPQAGEVEKYHRLLSDVLRRFVELRLGLPATQQTSAEFLLAAGQAEPLSPAARDLLRDFLDRCDLAKFARADFGVAECQTTAGLARQFVEQVKNSES